MTGDVTAPATAPSRVTVPPRERPKSLFAGYNLQGGLQFGDLGACTVQVVAVLFAVGAERCEVCTRRLGVVGGGGHLCGEVCDALVGGGEVGLGGVLSGCGFSSGRFGVAAGRLGGLCHLININPGRDNGNRYGASSCWCQPG